MNIYHIFSADEYAEVEVTIHVRRRWEYYVTNVLLVMFILGWLAFTAFVIPMDAVEDRLGVLLTLLLTFVAFKFWTATILPNVNLFCLPPALGLIFCSVWMGV